VLRQRARFCAPRSAGDEDGDDEDAPARGGAAPARPGAAAATAAPGKRSRDAAPPAAPPAKRAAPAAPPARASAGAAAAGKGAAAAKPKAPARPTPLAPHQQKLRDDIEAELRLQKQLSKKLKGRTARHARCAARMHTLRCLDTLAACMQRTLALVARADALRWPLSRVFGVRRRAPTTG
jgi:hypothetical protein